MQKEIETIFWNFIMWVYYYFQSDADIVERFYCYFKQEESCNQLIRDEKKQELAQFLFHQISSFGFRQTHWARCCFWTKERDSYKSQRHLIWLIKNKCLLPSEVTLAHIVKCMNMITHGEWDILDALLGCKMDARNITLDHSEEWIKQTATSIRQLCSTQNRNTLEYRCCKDISNRIDKHVLSEQRRLTLCDSRSNDTIDLEVHVLG
jgi:hypothetical protein